ncbi:MAG: hypothetical protein P0120_19740 [Nitrospira sp.]|nr:hypothetical protein [Nitrospira sp.]
MGTSSLILVHPTPIIAIHMSKTEEKPPPNIDVVLAGLTDFDAATIACVRSSAPDACTIRRSVASCIHGNW